VDCGEGRAKEEGKGSVPIVANLPNEHCLKNLLPGACLRFCCRRRFYRAMLCIRGTSHGPLRLYLSLCPSVTSRCSMETDERIELGFGM